MGWVAIIFVAVQEAPPPAPEAVVTARPFERPLDRIPGHVTVISRDEIARTPARHVADLLRRRAGVFAVTANQWSHDAGLDLRGFANGTGNAERVLFLLDGRRMNGISSGAADLATIPLENVERIEILRGPLAGLYGDGAVAAVVNVVTRAPTDDLRLRVLGEGGSFSTGRGAGMVTGKVGPVGMAISAEAITTEDYRELGSFRGGRTDWRVTGDITEWLRFRGAFGGLHDRRERPGNLSLAEIAALGRRGSVNAGNRSGVGTVGERYGVVGGEADLGPGLLEVTFRHRHENTKSRFFDPAAPLRSRSQDILNWLSASYTADFADLALPLSITLGAEHGWDTHHLVTTVGAAPDFRPTFRRRLIGLYAHGEVALHDRVRLSAGFRHDRGVLRRENLAPRSQNETANNPFVGLTVRPADPVVAYASWGRTFRFPNFFEVGAGALDPERASTFEVGARTSGVPWIDLSVALYAMDVRDELFLNPVTLVNANLRRVRHEGLEAEATVRPHERIDLFATYTNSVARIRAGAFRGRRFPVTPRHFGSGGLRVRPVEPVEITLTALVLGRRRLANDFTGAARSLASVARWDFEVAARWRDLRFRLLVQNLFNQHYFDNGLVTTAAPAVERFLPAPTRSFLLGIDWTF